MEFAYSGISFTFASRWGPLATPRRSRRHDPLRALCAHRCRDGAANRDGRHDPLAGLRQRSYRVDHRAYRRLPALNATRLKKPRPREWTRNADDYPLRRSLWCGPMRRSVKHMAIKQAQQRDAMFTGGYRKTRGPLSRTITRGAPTLQKITGTHDGHALPGMEGEQILVAGHDDLGATIQRERKEFVVLGIATIRDR